jgi:quercetin dioxygenase-like cupin family protein
VCPARKPLTLSAMKRSAVFLVACGALLGWVGHGVARARSERRSQVLVPQFENAAVTVWKTVLGPREKIGMHRHDHGRVVVALKGGALTIPQDDGSSRRLVLETGKAYWLDADPPGKLHGDDNQTDRTIEVMVVELKR